MTTYPPEWPRVRVYVAPNPYFRERGAPDAVKLIFAEDCPYCGRRHEHGAGSSVLGDEGSYGNRTPHCSAWHTHRTTFGSARRQRVSVLNQCPAPLDHPNYVLVPA